MNNSFKKTIELAEQFTKVAFVKEARTVAEIEADISKIRQKRSELYNTNRSEEDAQNVRKEYDRAENNLEEELKKAKGEVVEETYAKAGPKYVAYYNPAQTAYISAFRVPMPGDTAFNTEAERDEYVNKMTQQLGEAELQQKQEDRAKQTSTAPAPKAPTPATGNQGAVQATTGTPSPATSATPGSKKPSIKNINWSQMFPKKSSLNQTLKLANEFSNLVKMAQVWAQDSRFTRPDLETMKKLAPFVGMTPESIVSDAGRGAFYNALYPELQKADAAKGSQVPLPEFYGIVSRYATEEEGRQLTEEKSTQEKAQRQQTFQTMSANWKTVMDTVQTYDKYVKWINGFSAFNSAQRSQELKTYANSNMNTVRTVEKFLQDTAAQLPQYVPGVFTTEALSSVMQILKENETNAAKFEDKLEIAAGMKQEGFDPKTFWTTWPQLRTLSEIFANTASFNPDFVEKNKKLMEGVAQDASQAAQTVQPAKPAGTASLKSLIEKVSNYHDLALKKKPII